MQLRALTRSARGMTDNQCRASNEMGGLRRGRELTTTRVAKQGNTGWTWMHGWTGEVPVMVSSRDSVRLCLGGRVTRETANAWWWTIESAIEGWRRDLRKLVSSLFLGLVGNMTISTRGAFSTPGGCWSVVGNRNTSNTSGVE
jgi:hypothetical protein